MISTRSWIFRITVQQILYKLCHARSVLASTGGTKSHDHVNVRREMAPTSADTTDKTRALLAHANPRSSHVGPIIGAVIAGLSVLILLVILYIVIRRRPAKAKAQLEDGATAGEKDLSSLEIESKSSLDVSLPNLGRAFPPGTPFVAPPPAVIPRFRNDRSEKLQGSQTQNQMVAKLSQNAHLVVPSNSNRLSLESLDRRTRRKVQLAPGPAASDLFCHPFRSSPHVIGEDNLDAQGGKSLRSTQPRRRALLPNPFSISASSREAKVLPPVPVASLLRQQLQRPAAEAVAPTQPRVEREGGDAQVKEVTTKKAELEGKTHKHTHHAHHSHTSLSASLSTVVENNESRDINGSLHAHESIPRSDYPSNPPRYI